MTGKTIREIGRELAEQARTFPVWRGRYVWWMQLLEGAVVLGACWWAWRTTGGTWADFEAQRNTGPAVAAVGTFACFAVFALLVEAEARATTRREERARADARAATEARVLTVPDGYVLAYERVQVYGWTVTGDTPRVTVAAIPADRWDLADALWSFVVEPSPWPRPQREGSEAGLQLTLLSDSFAALAQAGPLLRELAEARQVATVERILEGRGARDVSAVFDR